MNRRSFLTLFSGVSLGAIWLPRVSYFFAPVSGWVDQRPWWHPDVLPGVLKELKAHGDEVRGYVPLNANQWQEARKLVAERRSDAASWQRWHVEDRNRRAPLANVVAFDLDGGRLPTPRGPVTARDLALEIDHRGTYTKFISR